MMDEFHMPTRLIPSSPRLPVSSSPRLPIPPSLLIPFRLRRHVSQFLAGDEAADIVEQDL